MLEGRKYIMASFCGNCGKKVSEDKNFCDNCGKKLKDDDNKNDGNKKICSFCKSKIDADAKVCPVCKKQLSMSWAEWILGIILGIIIIDTIYRLFAR